MNRCEACKFRARDDKNPQSMLGRIWKWHIGWCPGWKSYLEKISAKAACVKTWRASVPFTQPLDKDRRKIIF